MLADLIKIHCLTHGVTFPMSRTSRTVVCKEGSEEHTLSSNFPNQGLWIYCCNCQTFIAWDKTRADVLVKECPFCFSSLNPRLYCCDHCAVTMVDYDDQTLRKQHTVLTWGMPQPACPACHHFPNATPKMHFCESLKCNLATARAACPFCDVQIAQVVVIQTATNGARATMNDQVSPAILADAQAKAREAEERTQLAEATARKEIALRVQAERKAEEIERKITRELVAPGTVAIDPEFARREAELARAQADAEARARLQAEARAQESEEKRQQAEAYAQKQAEMRALAEERAYTMAVNQAYDITQPHPTTLRRDRVTIALYAALAGVLFFLLIYLIVTMIRLAGG